MVMSQDASRECRNEARDSAMRRCFLTTEFIPIKHLLSDESLIAQPHIPFSNVRSRSLFVAQYTTLKLFSVVRTGILRHRQRSFHHGQRWTNLLLNRLRPR